jgi:hypothetical protein
MIKHGEINPLNVFGLRRLEHCPPHFARVQIENMYVDPKEITDWIYENLTGRFCFIDDCLEVSDGQPKKRMQAVKCAGFEEPGEASMFSLVLDRINPAPQNTWY